MLKAIRLGVLLCVTSWWSVPALADDLVMPNYGSTGLLVSNDHGATFAIKTERDGLPDGAPLRIATSRGYVYAIMSSEDGPTLARSIDRGATFAFEAPRFDLVDVAAEGMTVAVLALQCRANVSCVGISQDAGATFIFRDLPASVVEPKGLAIAYGALHVVSSEGYHASTDYGASYFKMVSFDTAIETGASIAASDGSFVYLGTKATDGHLNGVFMSIDGGLTFTRQSLNGSMIGGETRVIDIHRGKVSVGTSSGLYVANVGTTFGRPYTTRDGMPASDVSRIFSSGVEAFVETSAGPWRVVLP